MKSKLVKVLKITLITAFWIGVWYLLFGLINEPTLFPAPHNVVLRLAELMKTSAFYITVFHSIIRIFIGLIIGILLGIVLAIPTARWRTAHDFLSPVMTVVKVTPVASFIFLLLLWIGRDFLPAVISICVVLPVVWTSVETGIKETDKSLIQMARAYRMNFWQKIRFIYLPAALPYFISAVRSSVGIAWKAGIAAEVLTAPLIAIGKQISESRYNIEPTDLFTWTLVAIIISVVIEKVILIIFEKIAKNNRYFKERSVVS